MAYKYLKQYIGTEDATAGTLLMPKLILGPMIEEADKALIPRELAAMTFSPNQLKGVGGTFNINLEEPNTLDVRKVGEGAEVPLDAMGHENVEFSPTKYGVAIRITREMMEDSQFELFQRNIRTAGKRFAEKENELIITALDSANSTTTGGAQITIANINESIFDLEEEDYEATDIIAGNEVIRDLRNIDTFIEANKAGTDRGLRTGNVGDILGTTVHRVSTNAMPSSTYSKYAYVLDRSQAYGLAIWRDLTVENFDLPTFDMQGAVLTWRFGVELLRSKAVSKITTS